MSGGPELETNRLLLRRWRPADLEQFSAINADPVTMEHLPSTLSEDESGQLIARIEKGFEEDGFGLWAVTHLVSGRLLGFAGLQRVHFESHFTPAVEVGWRLGRDHWGSGYATEAARAALRYGFDSAELPEIVSFAVPANTRSTRVMERLGMTRDPSDDFDHPKQPEGSPLRRHVLYRMSKERWLQVRRP